MKKMTVHSAKCSQCGKVFDVKATVREIKAFELAEVGIECPECNYWVHSYYTTPALEGVRKKLEKKSETARITKDLRLVSRIQEDIRAMRHQLRIDHDALQAWMKEQNGNPSN